MVCCKRPGKLGYFFYSWQAYCASNPGERAAMELISQHINGILKRNTVGCAKIEENCFFPFIHHQLQVCVCGICMTPGWVMNSRTSWKASYKVELSSKHVCSCCRRCFSTCCWGKGMERCVRERKNCSKTSWADMSKWLLADCVVFNDVWTGPCRLILRWCLTENNLLRDSIKGNQPARKPLVIAQPVFVFFSAGRVQKEVMAGKKEN